VFDDVKVFSAPSIGIDVVDTDDVTVNNCRSEDSFFHLISGTRCSNLIVSNSRLVGIGDAGIDPSSGGIGCLISDSPKTKIINNFISDTSDTGTKTSGCSDVTYTGNTVHRCGKDGIKIQYSQSQAEEPRRAVISNNIVKDLFSWRDDGSTCIQVSDFKEVTVTGNTVSSDPLITNDADKTGIRTFNHESGAYGQSGFITVTGNVVGQCAPLTSDNYGISVVGAAGGGHTQTINDNVVFAGIRGGDGYGPVVISGNVVGARNIDGDKAQTPGIRSVSRNSVISNNVIQGFDMGVQLYVDNPADDMVLCKIDGNIIEYVDSRFIDIGANSEALNCSITISGNTCREFTGIGAAAFRLRPTELNFDQVNITGNTIEGNFNTLISLFGITTEILGQFNVSGNTELSTNVGYFKTTLIDHCDRVTGDYAFTDNVAPPTDKKYRQSDVIHNDAIQAGRVLSWVCVDEGTQEFRPTLTLP
jgi:hypothetical protein